jgi:NTP pyrophosphatase (non-canonical NTP hydrolase)
LVAYPTPDNFHEYQALAALTDRGSGGGKPSFAAIGLFGEAGSVLSEVKKLQRDSISFETYYETVLEELGDTLWYLSTIASRSGVRLDHVAQDAAAFFNPDFVSSPVRFDDLERVGLAINFEPSPEYELALRKLGAQVGAILDEDLDSISRDQVTALLAMALHCLIDVSFQCGAHLRDVASYNLKKTLSRWPTRKYHVAEDRFEENYPEYEVLPKQLEIDIFEVVRDAKQAFVVQRLGDINVGDRLTDNILEKDDYRFHDVFHYAYAANLHWSPVLRALLKLKRKSRPEIDEAEDGARAILIEEGIATYVFNAAKPHFFKGMKTGQLSYDLLKSIRAFVSGFEVQECPPWLWEKAILEGFAAFRFLRRHRRGRVIMDTEKRRLTIKALPEGIYTPAPAV